jgi:hypothetical protein
VLASPAVAPVTTVLECARRADGGAAIVLASSRYLERSPLYISFSMPTLFALIEHY